MPGIPTHGAAGGHNVGDKPTMGKQESPPNAPSHGAAGGYEIPMSTHGASPQVRPEKNIKIGLKHNDPEFGK